MADKQVPILVFGDRNHAVVEQAKKLALAKSLSKVIQ